MIDLESSPQWVEREWLSLTSCIISASFLAFLPWRLWQLRRASVKVKKHWLAIGKIAVSGLYMLSKLAFVAVRWSLKPPNRPSADVDALLSLVATLGLGLLSFREHKRAVKPSTGAILYLTASSACDTLRLAAPSRPDSRPLLGLLSGQLLVEFLLLVLECWSKEAILRDEYRGGRPPEELASIFSVTYFWWMHRVLSDGYSKLLSDDQLPHIDRRLDSAKLRRAVLLAWNQRVKPEKLATLPKVLLSCFSAPMAAAVVPRLFLIAFRFSQPLLINRAIAYVQDSSLQQMGDEDSLDRGFWIVVAAAAVYFGLATSTAVYRHQLDRLQVMVRGALSGLVHHKALTSSSHGYDDATALTLINTDVAGTETAAEMLHELWGQFLEAVVGFGMLAVEIGWLWPLPLVVILFFTQTSRYAVRPMKSRQSAWNSATQQRISMTSVAIGAIKSIKMLGIQAAVENLILELRDAELTKAESARWVGVYYNASANALGMFAPVLTVALYAVLMAANGRGLDTRTAFTTVAILVMVTHPVNMVMTVLPRIAASLSSFERIQSYLLKPNVSDQRIILSTEAADLGFLDRMSPAAPIPAIVFRDVTMTSAKSSKPILQGVDLRIEKGTLAVFSGAVGSGKTSLIYAALGELDVQGGTITVESKRMAFCSQAAWLPNLSIRDCILGLDENTAADESRYDEALRACCLSDDLAELPDGDRTVVGTNGQGLSGGQRQRVALARAVYARRGIYLLDDSFSALDAKTQASVIRNLLGPGGLLRKPGTTVIWATNSSGYFHMADKIVVLGNGKVELEGSWDDVQAGDHDIFRHMKQLENTSSAQDEQLWSLGPSGRTVKPLPPKSNAGLSTSAADLNRKDGDLSLYSYYFHTTGAGNVLFLVACTVSYSFFIMFPQYWLKWWTESSGGHTLVYTSGYVLLLVMAWITTNMQMWLTVIIIAPTSGRTLHYRLLKSIFNAPLVYFSKLDVGQVLNRFSQDIQLVDKQIASALQSLFVQICKLAMQAILLLAVQPRMGLTLPVCVAAVYVVQKLYLRTSRQLRWLELESRSAVSSSCLETVQGLVTIRAFGWPAAAARANAACLDDSQRPLYLLLCLQRWLNVVLDMIVACLAVSVVWLAVVLSHQQKKMDLSASRGGGQIGVALNVIILVNTTLLRLVQSWTSLEVSLGAVARLRESVQETPQEEAKEGPADDMADDSADFVRTEDSLPVSWPASGRLELVDVTASYSPGVPVLRNVSLSVQPGQVVVICGRTGSGKTSLLMALLRLVDVQSGHVTIDGVDLAGLPLAQVRQRAFVTVAQDPLLLPAASLRFHLDPSGTLPDAALAVALDKTGLRRVFMGDSCGDNDTRSTDDTDDTDNTPIWDRQLSAFPVLSAGQAQLLALARALLQTQAMALGSGQQRRRPVLLLDEITSSLDAATEAAVHSVVEDIFVKGPDGQHHTVVVVTHRLGALADRLRPGRDAVVWMANGRVEGVEEQ